MNVIEILEKNNDKSGCMLKENFLKKKFPEIHKIISDFAIEHKIEDLKFVQKIYHFKHDLKEYKKCETPECENKVRFLNYVKGYSHHCSPSCKQKDPKVREKSIKTSQKKYGTDYPSQNKEIRDKQKETCKEKYGFESPAKCKSVVDNMKLTNFKRYGVEFQSQREEVQDKFYQTITDKNIERYKEINLISIDYQNKKMILKCDQGLEHEYEIDISNFQNRKRYKTVFCTKCNPMMGVTSGEEIKLQQFIQENYQGEILTNKRSIISPFELDIYLPELKLAFEFNGLWWHNELNKSNDYHLKKLELCESKGIRLIQIWEDGWRFKKDIVKSRILNLLGKSERIFARKCQIKEINDTKIVKDFLENNHTQGNIFSSVEIGLFFNNELVSLMTFGKNRKSLGKKSKKDEYELLRFCNKLNFTVIGGANRLFQNFIKNYKPEKIISYADRSWSQGNLYIQLGFKFDRKTKMNYYYVIDGVRRHRFNYRKDVLIKQGNDSNKTEREIMIEKNIYRIYDSGNLKFVYEK